MRKLIGRTELTSSAAVCSLGRRSRHLLAGLPPAVHIQIIDENLGIPVLSFTRWPVAHGHAILITDRPDLDAILGDPGRNQAIADNLGPLLGKISGCIPITLVVGTADHNDRQIGPDAEPARLMLDQTSRPPTEDRAVFGKEHAIADIDQESLAVFCNTLRFVGFDGRTIIRIAIATIEYSERALRPLSFRRSGIVTDDPR